jgi:hypothetical protein
MTRATQKQRERFYAKEAARLLGRQWDFGNGDSERPDFIVTEDGRQFGLEVTQVFIGEQGATGSVMKAEESKKQRALDNLRRQYEALENIPLSVKFVGTIEAMGADNLATVIPALLAHDLPSKPVGYRFVHDTTVAHPARSRLRVHVTKAFRAEWTNMADRAGFVDRNPHGHIDAAIAKKSAGLASYKAKAGGDVRLLLIADRISNSGKLTLDAGAQLNLRGFDVVYLFPYPENVIVLGGLSLTRDGRAQHSATAHPIDETRKLRTGDSDPFPSSLINLL